MIKEDIYASTHDVSMRAAGDAVQTLAHAIEINGRATWVLAGGSSPMAAYQIIADTYSGSLDWSKVIILIGDERCVPLDHADSNWGSITRILFANPTISQAVQLIPTADQGAEKGAINYSEQIRRLCGEIPQFDLLWLGVGEDGHTLSLFPGHPGLNDSSNIVIPIHDSPKPPPDRISLSLQAATNARKVIIFATGATKQAALRQIKDTPHSLPVGLLAQSAHKNGANVTWLFDQDAKLSPLLTP